MGLGCRWWVGGAGRLSACACSAHRPTQGKVVGGEGGGMGLGLEGGADLRGSMRIGTFCVRVEYFNTFTTSLSIRFLHFLISLNVFDVFCHVFLFISNFDNKKTEKHN